ncbi:hypothetical protein [Microcoleus sp. FACHB-68]|uniref:hypothetical protein n=1 Tax=Microcoleus sp. FACHB-68 TaxID=2692826 RepID=UPI0018F041FE|nr:hypothetical protein [Microcoleus sp. FACHB-68]
MSGSPITLILVKELDPVAKMVSNPQNEPGFLTPDAGPDTSRASYSDALNPDRNDSSHDDENVDVPVPEPSGTADNPNVVDRQINITNRSAG